MNTRLKICGITSLSDAELTVRLGVNILGFNFYPASPRYIEPEQCRSILEKLPFFVISVGILVRPDRKMVDKILERSGVKVLQILEPVDFTDFYDIPVPVIYVHRMMEPLRIDQGLRGARMVLLDSFVSNVYGGSGRSWDWGMLPADFPREKLVLAGGIHPGNIKKALEAVQPAIVDVASGAETAPGKKDPRKIQSLVEAITDFNRQNNPLSLFEQEEL